MNVAKNIKLCRKRKDLSQNQLVKLSKVTHSTLVKLERGANDNPTIKTLVKLADTLNVSLDELIGRKSRR